MDYTQIGTDQQRELCRGRLAGYEGDHYGHTLNLAALQSLPDEDGGKEAAVRNEQKALATLESSIGAMRKEMDRLDTVAKKEEKAKS